jgi:endonuclease/exonuclease/phosphatase family metal-dependent hydrolase
MIVRKHHIAFALALLLMVLAIGVHTCQRLADSPRVASFNINQYPKRTYEPDRLFQAVRELDAPIVALQEIGDIHDTREHVYEHLGTNWKVRNAARCNTRCLGFLYDSNRVEIVRTRTHESVRLHPGGRPAYEAHVTIDGKPMTLVNVHLKAGKKDKEYKTRKAQLEALRAIVASIDDRGESVVLLGDFNSVRGDDRAALESFARTTGLSWATSVLECSHYYRGSGRCIAGTLDHAFTSHRARSVEEAGDCATVGCDPGASCPTWRSQVSDHCPFVVQVR